jgi:transcription elongation factor Elf1
VSPSSCAKYVVKASKAKSTVRSSQERRILQVTYPTLDLTEPVDIYSEWIDAADHAAKEEERRVLRRPVASSSRARPAGPPSNGSEEE